MSILKMICRQTWRDARAGDLRLLGLAVVIAVAAVTSVGFWRTGWVVRLNVMRRRCSVRIL